MVTHASPSALVLALLIITAPQAFGQTPTRDVTRPNADGTALLSGTIVTDDTDSRPVRRVRVAIVTSDRQVGRTTITDDAGAFRFAGLPAGRYTLSATKQGFVGLSYGAKRPNRPGTAIVLADGQRMTGVTLRMTRGSVISGVLVDQNGEPFSGASVMVMRYAFAGGGQRTLTPAGGGNQTDDRGQYRIWGLAAGEYVVAASLGFAAGFSARLDGDVVRLSDADVKRAIAELGSGAARPGVPGAGSLPAADARARTVGYATVFYPGTFVASQATSVKVSAADERSGIDFQLPLVRTAKVEGTVAVPDGVSRRGLLVQMIDTNPQGLMLDSFRRSTPTADGNFSFAGVPPGQYTIAVRGQPAGQTAGRPPAAPGGAPAPIQATHWALAEVTVDGQDLSGLSLMLQPGFTVSGRIQFEGTASPPQDLTRLRVNLAAVQSPGEVSLGVSAIQADASGSFSIAGVTPGRYRLIASLPSRPDTTVWQPKSSIVNGRDTLDFPLDLRESVESAVITLTDRMSELAGAVQDASGEPAPEYYVIVFASDKNYWTPQSRRIRSVRPVADGKYTFRSLPPGEYLLTAVTDIEPGEWYDPALLDQLSRSALKITLAEGEKKTQDLRLAFQIP